MWPSLLQAANFVHEKGQQRMLVRVSGGPCLAGLFLFYSNKMWPSLLHAVTVREEGQE